MPQELYSSDLDDSGEASAKEFLSYIEKAALESRWGSYREVWYGIAHFSSGML